MNTAAAEAPKPQAKKKESPVLMPSRFALAEFRRHDWVADVESGRTVEDILQPSYWTHIAPQLQPYDHIEARAEDGKWIAFLIVLFSENNYAQVIVDRVLKIEANADTTSPSAKYKVDWKGPHYKYVVIRVSDDQMLHSGCKTRDEASSWLKNHEAASSR